MTVMVVDVYVCGLFTDPRHNEILGCVRRLGVEAPVIHVFGCFKLQAYSVFLGTTPWPQHCKRIPCCLYDSGQRPQALYSQGS